MPAPSSSKPRTRPSSLACTECRKHHLKCDAKQPSCSRCSAARIPCTFLPSRRGRARRIENTQREPCADASPRMQLQTEPGALADMPVNPDPGQIAQIRGDSGFSDSVVPEYRLISLFYENFHPAHPILVPASLYGKWQYPQYLHQVVRFIGTQYSVILSNDTLQESTWATLNGTTERTPHMVQALLMYSIISRARNENTQSEASLSQAIDIAIEIGMHREDSVTTLSGQRQHEAESLRRTWWGLFIWEIQMASIHQKFHLRCGEILSDVNLPCEESTYASLHAIPQPQSLAAFRARLFADTEGDMRFSSFAYCIEAARILARVLVLNGLPETHQDNLQAVANTLVSWIHHLPQEKVDIVDMYGNIDEMLFQAHMTIQYAAMLLHLPRSNLRVKFPDPTFSICPVTLFRLSPSLTRHVHDVKAIDASKKLSNLLSVRAGAQGYSPHVVFGSLLCGLVQLSATERHGSVCADHHQNRVILVLGCLKLLKDKWALAQEAYSHLRSATAQINTASTEFSPFEDKTMTTESTQNLDMELNTEVAPILETAASDQFPTRLLSEFMDPTCGDSFPLYPLFGDESLPNNFQP